MAIQIMLLRPKKRTVKSILTKATLLSDPLQLVGLIGLPNTSMRSHNPVWVEKSLQFSFSLRGQDQYAIVSTKCENRASQCIAVVAGPTKTFTTKH